LLEVKELRCCKPYRRKNVIKGEVAWIPQACRLSIKDERSKRGCTFEATMGDIVVSVPEPISLLCGMCDGDVYSQEMINYNSSAGKSSVLAEIN
jgi:hypothetical protein